MATLPFITHAERMTGSGHPTRPDTLNRAFREALELSGYDPDAATFPGFAGPVYNVVAYGASPTATPADNVIAINAAATASGTKGLLFFPPGLDFPTDGTVTFHGPVLARGSRLAFSGTGVAIAVGDGTAYLQNVQIELPEVYLTTKTGLGWAAGDTGVRVQRLFNSDLHVPWVRNFETGLDIYGDGEGGDYNRITIGHLSNNKRNLVTDASLTGWINENVFLGGRLGHDPAEGTAVAGTRHIAILGAGGAVSIPNNHRFIGLSLEGEVAEYVAEVKGPWNEFIACRWEATTPRVLFDTTNAVYNRIRSGYDSNRVEIVETNGAHANGIESSNGLRLAAGPADGVMVLVNENGSDSPILQGLPASASPHDGVAANNSGYGFELTSQHLRGKQPGDAAASPRLDLNFSTGDIKMNIARFATLQAAGALTSATVLGSVTKRIMLLDSDGNIAGYIPVYNSIT